MKKIILLISVIIMAVLMVGCSKKKKAGHLTIWWPGGSDAEKAAVEFAAAKYMNENPAVTIEIIPQMTTDFWVNYTMSINGSNFPDIAYVDHVYVQRLVYEGYIANLSKAGISDVIDKYIPSLIEPNKYEGDVYALPMSANVLTTVYNKTLIKKCLGYTDENFPSISTFADLEMISDGILAYNAAHHLTGNSAYIPYTVPAGSGHFSMGAMFFLSYVAREGGSIISSDLKTMTLTSAACMNAANRIKQLGTKKYSESVFGEGKFEDGRVAFIEMGPWKMEYYSRISVEREFEICYAPILKFYPTGTNQSSLGLFSLVATDKSPNKNLAIDFMKYVTTNKEIQLMNNTAQNLLPVTKDAVLDDFYSGEVWQVFVNQLNSIVARPGSPEWPTMEDQLASFVTDLINGSREPSYLVDINYGLQQGLNDIYN